MLIGIAGAIGTGKSFTQLKKALEHCERKKKNLVTNFEINERALFEYAEMMKYDFVMSMIVKDKISWIVNPHKKVNGKMLPNLEAMFIPRSVICLDEAGIFLNSRDFQSTSKDLLSDLCQSRKLGVDMFWAAQFQEQVDKQFRLLTQYWVHCDSVSFYDKKLGNSKLKWKKIYTFKAADYFEWLSNPRDRSSHFKTRFGYSTDYEGGTLTKADRKIFEVYNSFDRLDLAESKDKVRSSLECPLAQHVRYVSTDLPYTPPSWTLPPYDLSPSPPPTDAKQGGGGERFTIPVLI